MDHNFNSSFVTMFSVVLIFLSFLSPLLSKNFRNESIKFLIFFWIVILLRHFISLQNFFFGPTYGAEADALSFHITAEKLAENSIFNFGVGSQFFRLYLSIVYSAFGPNILLSQTLGIWAYIFSVVYLIKIKNLIKLRKGSILLIFIIGLDPAMSMWIPITIREPYQIFFFNCSIFYGIHWHLKRSGASLFFALCSGLMLGMLHNGLTLYFIFYLFVLIFWRFKFIKEKRLIFKKISWVLFFLCCIFSFLSLNDKSSISPAFDAFNSFKAVEYVENYRSKAKNCGSNYELEINQSHSNQVFISLKVFFKYFFGPFPWEVKRPIDAVALFSTIIRIILLFSSINLYIYASSEKKSNISFILLSFFAIEILWSLGTLSYGTAMRHHMVGNGVLVLLGAPNVTNFFQKLKACFSINGGY